MQCKVAVIDSGINTFYKLRTSICINYLGDSCFDENGHGTKSVAMINKIAPNTDFTIVKILDRNLKCTSGTLCKALMDVLVMNVDVVNLSLSTADIKHFDELDNICKLFYQKGILIIASKSNNNEKSYPAESKYTLGVCGSLFQSNETFWYESNKFIQLVGCKTPSILKIDEYTHSFYGGNSKATCCITGIISSNWRTLNSMDIEEKKRYLSSLSAKSIWTDKDLLDTLSPSESNFYSINIDIENTIKSIILQHFKSDSAKILNTNLIYENIGLRKCEEFFYYIVDYYNLHLLSGEFNVYDFISLKGICRKIESIVQERRGSY